MDCEKKFRIITENLEDVIWITDIESKKITYVSPSIEKLLGYSVEEALDVPFNKDPKVNESYLSTQQEINKIINSGDNNVNRRFEYQIPNKKGVQVWVETIVRIISENNKPKELLGITRNIEERKKVSIKLQKYSDKLEKLTYEKDRFIQILAHDLRSPFNSLLGISNILLENINKYDSEKIERLSKLINQKLYETFSLLEDLLIWSQSGKLLSDSKSIVLSDIYLEIYAQVKSNIKNIKINYFETEKIEFETDARLLKVILRNFISNAIKFTNINGQINVIAEKKSDQIIITVSDNGIGMDDLQKSKLWGKSNLTTTIGTNKEQGTGLGLSFCKELIEKLGGTIWVKSEKGKGTDFKFSLPI